MLKKIKGFVRRRFSDEISTEELIGRGLTVGKNFSRQEECIIDPSHCWLITIGDNVTLAPRVHILAHDASTKMHFDYTKIGNVKIGNGVFIGAGTIILPNVAIGDKTIIGAGSVVSKDIPANSVAVGNPAKVVMSTDDYLAKQAALFESNPVYDESYTLNGQISEQKKLEQKSDLAKQIGFVK